MFAGRAATRRHQGEMLSLERDPLAGVLSAQGRKLSLSSPPGVSQASGPCPSSWWLDHGCTLFLHWELHFFIAWSC